MKIDILFFFTFDQNTPVNIKKLGCVLAGFLLMSCNEDKFNKLDREASFPAGDSAGPKISIPGLPEMTPLYASMSVNDLLAQSWEMEDDVNDLMNSSPSDQLRMPLRSLYFSPDNTFIKNPRNVLLNGTWSLDEKTMRLSLKYDDSKADVYKIHKISATQLELTDAGLDSETPLVYVSGGKRYKVKEENPFFIGNNKWRIAASHSESDEQIRSRVKEHVKFFILFYKDVIARNVNVVSFVGLPTCLKFYGPGVLMQPVDRIVDSWNEIFFNEEDQAKAYKIMSIAVKKKYTWPKGNLNWIEKNALILEEIYKNL